MSFIILYKKKLQKDKITKKINISFYIFRLKFFLYLDL